MVSADTYYLLPYQNVSGTATAVAGGQPIATGPYVDSMPGTNINPDPFFTRIDDYEYVGQYRSYFGTLTRNDTDSAALGYFGNTLSATGSGLVSRYILLSDLGLLPGDVVTIGIHATTSALITVALQFSNAARGVIGGYGATTTLTAGTGIRYLTATVPPSGAVHLQVGLSNSATKKLFAFVVAKGPFKPAFVPPRPPAVNALPENLYYDTCNQLISNNGKQLGKVPYVSTIDGNPLMGLLNIDPGGTGLSLVAAPAQSPFKTPAIRLPASSNGHDLFVEVSRLGLRVGDTLHIVFGYVATQIMTNAVRLTNAAGTLVGTEIQRSADVRDPSNAIGYGEVTIEMPVTQTILDGIPTKMRLRMESPIGAAGAFLIGVSIAKQKHSLRDIMGSVRGADIVARSAAPARTIGRYAVILSDSIFGTAIKTQDNPDTYPYMVFSERLGMKVTHTGLGGTTAARRGDDANYDALSMSAIGGYIRTGNFAPMIAAAAALANSEVILKVAELAAVDWTQVGEIFCAYGTNDWAAVPTPLGTINDMTGNTFYGAYNLFLQDVLTKYPQIRVRLVTAKYCDRFTLNGYGLGSINGTVMTITSAIYAGYTVGDTVYQEGVKERAYIVPGGTGTGGVGTYNLSKNLGVTPVPGLYVGDIISSANDNLNSDVYANAAGNTLLTLNAAINAIGTKHHLKVLPFAEQCGINRYTIHRNSPDGFHLSQLYGFDEGVGFAAVLWGQA
ncbi:MAG: hypothetical protein EON59_04485 [Alphaproteobacteria bacterium]|nr:MAG: hypothetical protein EON59_04485 [Alphaproteobacteria bacterium]